MAAGSNGSFEVASFMSYYWETMSMQIGEDVELLRWQGDTDSVMHCFLYAMDILRDC